MRTKLAALCACLALAACATTPQTHLEQGKGTAAAWASLDAVAVTIDGLATTRVLHGPQAAKAADGLIKARDALVLADKAYTAGDGATAEQNVATASALIASLLILAQGAKP